MSIKLHGLCPECGGQSDLVPFTEATEPGHRYCVNCKQELFTNTIDYSDTVSSNLKHRLQLIASLKEIIKAWHDPNLDPGETAAEMATIAQQALGID
jgi:superfamily II helicase